MLTNARRNVRYMMGSVGLRCNLQIKNKLEATGFEPMASYMRIKHSASKLHRPLITVSYIPFKMNPK